MDQLVQGNVDLEADIESGGPDDICDRTENLVSANMETEKAMNRVWSRYLNSDGSEKSMDDSGSSNDISKLGGLEHEALPLIRDNVSGKGRDQGFDGKYKKNSSKAPKPPRPPKGPSLSENDQKLVREIAELAMRKRARIERMKKLKKMKEAKRPSSCNSIFAMVVTFFFLLIVIFQGLFSGDSATLGSDGSPAPAISANEGLISVQFFNDFAPRERNNPSSTSVRYLEKRVSGADPEEDGRNVSR